MNKNIIDFLVAKYGDRVDFPQPISNTDMETIQNQLAIVDKKLKKAKRIGLLLISIGIIWSTMSVVTLTEIADAINIFKAGPGIFYFVYGFVLFNQVAELKKKKIILETILFVSAG